MIIQCQSCSRKFLVRDADIPQEGRVVQCGFCSITWHQKPVAVSKPVSESQGTQNINENLSVDSIKASDGKTYKFLGSQWAELLPSGKTGLFAKKKIGKELDKLTGRKEKIVTKKKQKKIKEVDPSSVSLENEKRLPDIYKPKEGLGFFGYVFLIIIVSLSLVGVSETFKKEILQYIPQSIYLFETIENILIIITDFFKSY